MPREGARSCCLDPASMGADEATCREAAWDEFAHTLSQLLHGEQAALQLCGQLTNACPTMDAEVLRRLAGHRRGAPRRGVREVPAAQDGHDLPDRPHAEGPARQAARRADLEDQDARHADASSRAWRSASSTMLRVEPEPAAHRHDPPRRAGRGASRRLRHPHHAPRGEGGDAGGDGRDGGLRVRHPRDAQRQPAARHAAAARSEVRPRPATTSSQMVLGLPNWAELNSEIFMHTVVPNLRASGSSPSAPKSSTARSASCSAIRRRTATACRSRADGGDQGRRVASTIPVDHASRVSLSSSQASSCASRASTRAWCPTGQLGCGSMSSMT